MNISQALIIVGLSTIVLTSCFGKNSNEQKPQVINWVTQNNLPNSTSSGMTQEETLRSVNAAKEERERLLRIDTLTAENLKTQTEEKDGKTTLKDRRLFINYIKSKNITTSKEVLEHMWKIKKFLNDSKITLSEPDIMTIIGITDTESTNWDMCWEFYNSKSKLDSKNEFYIAIDKLCPPKVGP